MHEVNVIVEFVEYIAPPYTKLASEARAFEIVHEVNVTVELVEYIAPPSTALASEIGHEVNFKILPVM